jgi:hypothetical protein
MVCVTLLYIYTHKDHMYNYNDTRHAPIQHRRRRAVASALGSKHGELDEPGQEFDYEPNSRLLEKLRY